jgi:methyl-accepting chemotaxis protein
LNFREKTQKISIIYSFFVNFAFDLLNLDIYIVQSSKLYMESVTTVGRRQLLKLNLIFEKTGEQNKMKKLIVLSAMLLLGMLGMACDPGTANKATNTANTMANTTNSMANDAKEMANDAKEMANDAKEMANDAKETANKAMDNAEKKMDDKKMDDKKDGEMKDGEKPAANAEKKP